MVESLSLFVGTGQCNAKCAHCAGVPLRKFAPKKDGIIDRNLLEKTIRDCYENGARYLSISSSGEPTLSPKSVSLLFDLLQSLEKEEIKFSPINLYSNGIRIGKDKNFVEQYLPLWQSNGLTTIYITIHNINESKNAQIYGIKKYPSLQKIFTRIHKFNLKIRANLVLSRETIGTAQEFQKTINHLLNLGIDSISAWPIRTLDDKVDNKLCPTKSEWGKMEEYVQGKKELKGKIRLLGGENRNDYFQGKKLTLFPNGVLSNTWCN